MFLTTLVIVHVTTPIIHHNFNGIIGEGAINESGSDLLRVLRRSSGLAGFGFFGGRET